MSKMESSPSLWAPRHSGWRLAHHLLASFVLLAFLAGSGTYALLSQKSVLATGLLASALAVLLGVVAAFRRSPADRAVVNMAVLTSSGPRAATWFPMFRTSAKGAAAIMGLSVVILVATVSLSARLLLIHNYEPRGLVLVLTALLLAIGVFVLNRGIRMARLAVTAQEPGSTSRAAALLSIVHAAPEKSIGTTSLTSRRQIHPATSPWANVDRHGSWCCPTPRTTEPQNPWSSPFTSLPLTRISCTEPSTTMRPMPMTGPSWAPRRPWLDCRDSCPRYSLPRRPVGA